MTRLLSFAFLLLGCSLATSAMPDWYTAQCTPANCVPPSCMCASASPPGGLAPSDTPQFIVLTHDDAVNALSAKLMRSIADAHTNPNGCNVPITWYTLQIGTDCSVAKKLWEMNHEIALHTVNHVSLYENFAGNMKTEMFGVKSWLNATCGIPAEEMVGYRDPFLVQNPTTRKLQYQAKMLYDSSMIQSFGPYSDTESGPGQRLWPFTMDHGIPIDCNWNYPDGSCNRTAESYPGLWEVSLWELQSAAGDHLYSMDVGVNPPADIFNVLQENFNFTYDNNRAPFGIFLHSTVFDEAGAHAAAVNRFLDWAMAQPNVWAVTTKDLVRWMQAPVPASQMADWLKCRPVDLAALGEARCQLYIVADGDSSYAVATKFAVTMDDFLAVNPEVNPDSLTVGQQVRIPAWDNTCVGDAIKTVTGPGQVAPTPSVTPTPTPGAPATPPAPEPAAPGAVDYLHPASGVNITITLIGRPAVAFQTDLKTPFLSELSRALGVDQRALTMMGATPVNAVAGRRRLTQAVPEKPVVTVVVRGASADPEGLAANATAVLTPGSTFDTQNLALYQLSLQGPAALAMFKDGQLYDPSAPPAPATTSATPASDASVTAADSDSGSSLSTGAIVGIAVGATAFLAAAVLAAVVVVRRRRAAAAAKADADFSPMHSSTASERKFSAGTKVDMEATA